MDVDRWHRLEELFDQAMACPDGERSRFLAQACTGDEELHREIADDENPLLTPPPYRPLAASPYRASGGATHLPSYHSSPTFHR